MGKTVVYAREADASSFYRLVEPAAVLVERGYDVECIQLGGKAGFVAVNPETTSTVVVNRPIQADMATVVEDLVKLGVRVVVDMDDDFDHIRSTHSMYGIDTTHLHRACKAASVVTVTTPALLGVYGYGHGVVVPQAIPARYLGVENAISHYGLWVGWSGTVTSHPGDLQASEGGIAKFLRENIDTASLAYVGPFNQRPAVKRALKWRGPVFCHGWVPLSKYPEAIAQFDVGVVPLESCTFNDAKSCLKGLELAALGVPFVASPSPEYRTLHEQGAGILAKTRNDWSRSLAKLASDPDYRAQVALEGRQTALSRTLEAQHALWVSSWAAEQKIPQNALQ